MSVNVPRGFTGFTQIKKKGGSGPLTTDTVVNIPVHIVNPRAPKNNSYGSMVNKSMYPSTVVRGVITPSLGFRTGAKTSWFTANLLNSLVFTADTYGDNDKFALLSNDGTTTKKFDGGRCTAISLAGSAAGGELAVEMGFLAQTDQGAETFSSFTEDAGEMINRAQIDFGSSPTMDLISAWRINWLRGVGYDMFYNQTYYPKDTSAGMFGGTLQLEMSPLSAIIPSTTGTIRLFTGVPGSLTLFMTLAFLLNLDEEYEDVTPGPGVLIRTYSMIDLSAGGNPSAVS